MKTPDCITFVCNSYRELFSSDAAMAQALGIAPEEALPLTCGAAYPTLDAMVQIQSALRREALAAERKKGGLRSVQSLVY